MCAIFPTATSIDVGLGGQFTLDLLAGRARSLLWRAWLRIPDLPARPAVTPFGRQRDEVTALNRRASRCSIEDPAQSNECDRAENSLGQNVPGDGFILEFALENLVSEEKGINANQKNNQSGGHGD